MSEEEPGQKPMSEALDDFNLIFAEILKCAMMPFSISYEAFLGYNRQLEAIEAKIKDLKVYLERKTR